MSEFRPQTGTDRRTLGRIIAVAILITLLMSGVIFYGRHASQDSTLSKAVTRQPERLTELHFADPDSLPTTYAPGQPIDFSFIIHNREARTMRYDYRVLIGKDTAVTTENVTLDDGRTETIHLHAVVPENGERTPVRVELITKKQSVHFWLERSEL